MSSLRRIVILTAISFLFSNLFVKQSWAAKQDPTPDYEESQETTENADQQKGNDLENVDVAKPPHVHISHSEDEYFYPYNRALSGRFGGAYDSSKYSNQGVLWLLGVIYLYRFAPNEYYDFGFDIRNDSYGNIHAERRWISGRSATRPYYKAGVGLNLVPNDQLATLLRLNNYQVRGAIGFEQIFIAPMSFRYELELLQSDSTTVILSLGYSWGW